MVVVGSDDHGARQLVCAPSANETDDVFGWLLGPFELDAKLDLVPSLDQRIRKLAVSYRYWNADVFEPSQPNRG